MQFVVLLASLGMGWLAFCVLPLKRQRSALAGPDPELERVLAAARGGEWKPAAELLRTVGRDWERRAHCSEALSHLAAGKGDGWLKAWREARPDDPDAALVHARARVAYAWELRGAKFARDTSQKQFEGFFEVLVNARDDIGRAMELNPDDPTPYITEIWRALGLGYPNREMQALWAEIEARAPHHYEAHYSALQYWCAKWRGSNRMAREFAEAAAAKGPAGSLMTVFPLIAWYEANLGEVPASEYAKPQVRAMVDAALADVAAAGDHPRLPEVRHLLAHFLLQQGRCRAAVEQFRLVDGYVKALPWHYNQFAGIVYRISRTRAGRRALLERLLRR